MPSSTTRTARLRNAACAAPGNDRASSSVIPQAYDTITPFAYRSDKCSYDALQASLERIVRAFITTVSKWCDGCSYDALQASLVLVLRALTRAHPQGVIDYP